jgi:hypothetical protein
VKDDAGAYLQLILRIAIPVGQIRTKELKVKSPNPESFGESHIKAAARRVRKARGATRA